MENKPEPPAEKPVNPSEDSESLEATTTVVEDSATTPAADTAAAPAADGKKPEKKKKRNPVGGLAGKLNIYFLAFLLLLIIAGVTTAISIIKNGQANNQNEQIKTEPLSQEALDQLRQTDVKVGDPKQILSVESNAIFAGKVLIRDSLEVAGTIKAGGPLDLPGLTISGNSVMNQVQANILQVSGTATIQGQLAVQNNLTVTGNGTFGGTLTAGRLNIQDLQIAGDLQIARHIDAGGGTPGLSNGSALGGGGTASVSGTDTAGTVAINTGGGPGAGCFATINFTQRFNGTPHVVVTPVGSAAGSLNWYINRSSTNFSICTANSPPGGSSFAFDYVAID